MEIYPTKNRQTWIFTIMPLVSLEAVPSNCTGRGANPESGLAEATAVGGKSAAASNTVMALKAVSVAELSSVTINLIE